MTNFIDFINTKAWAETLTDAQLSVCLQEMRNRGAAIAIYDAGEIQTMYDGFDFVTDLDAWMEENRDHVEETMCEAARSLFESELQPFEPDSEENDGNPFHPESPEGRAWRDGRREF